MESEKTAKWQYTRHCEELTVEIKKLREEVHHFLTLQFLPFHVLKFRTERANLPLLTNVEIVELVEVMFYFLIKKNILPEEAIIIHILISVKVM